MVVREKLGLVEFDVIWTQIKQRGMCLNISTSQALKPKLKDCGGLRPIITFIGLSSTSTHPNKFVVLSSRLRTGNALVDAQVQTIKTIPKRVRHALPSFENNGLQGP